MKEHHGVEISFSAVRTITETHAGRAATVLKEEPPATYESSQMILEMDGEMLPLVEYRESTDKRKTKQLKWGELRVSVVQIHEHVEWRYASSFKSAEELGERTKVVMKSLGLTENTRVHGVGDGACWIPQEGERLAGSNFSYIIDQPHLCEYLSAAVAAWAKETREEVQRLKKLADEGKIEVVVSELRERQKEYLDHEGISDCLQYIGNRPGQFAYDTARAKGLPVGSGKVESTHRSLMQKRLKKPGTWWLKSNADQIADLRTLRANGRWAVLWQAKSNNDVAPLAA